MKKKTNETISTYEREMQDPGFKTAFESEYQQFALSELFKSLSEGNEKSVRRLAEEAGLHPNAIQNIKSGKTSDIKLSTFLKLAEAFGFTLELVKENVHIPVTSKRDDSEEYQVVH